MQKEVNWQKVEMLVEQAEALLNLRKFDAAGKKYLEILKIDNTNEWAYYGMGLVHLNKNELGEAKKISEDGLKIIPDSPLLHNILYRYHKIKGDTNKAFENAYRSTELAPYDVYYKKELFRCIRDTNFTDKRLKELGEEIMRLDPIDTDFVVDYAVYFINSGQQKIAEELLINSLKLDPQNSYAHCNLGLIYENRRKYGKAIDHFAVATKLNPNLNIAREKIYKHIIRPEKQPFLFLLKWTFEFFMALMFYAERLEKMPKHIFYKILIFFQAYMVSFVFMTLVFMFIVGGIDLVSPGMGNELFPEIIIPYVISGMFFPLILIPMQSYLYKKVNQAIDQKLQDIKF